MTAVEPSTVARYGARVKPLPAGHEPWQPRPKGWRMRVEPTNRWASKPERSRGSGHQGRGHGRPWQRLSLVMRANHPFCQVCNTRPSAEVHHLVKWHDNPAKRLDARNLLAVCRDCHAKLETKHPRG